MGPKQRNLKKSFTRLEQFNISSLDTATWHYMNDYNEAPVTRTAHYDDVIMGVMASQITSLTIVYTTAYSGADQRKKSKLRVSGLCVVNSPVTGEFPTQMASNVENVSI